MERKHRACPAAQVSPLLCFPSRGKCFVCGKGIWKERSLEKSEHLTWTKNLNSGAMLPFNRNMCRRQVYDAWLSTNMSHCPWFGTLILTFWDILRSMFFFCKEGEEHLEREVGTGDQVLSQRRSVPGRSRRWLGVWKSICVNPALECLPLRGMKTFKKRYKELG